MSKKQAADLQAQDSRRSPQSGRRMTPTRRLYYYLGMPVLRAVARLLMMSYRCEAVIGAKYIEPFLHGQAACAPTYWHGHHVLCSNLVRQWIKRGFKACFLISGSVDGEVPERVARAYGAEVIRGPAKASGTLALRDQHTMMKKGFSIITTPDGPGGPNHEMKTGVIIMARVGGIPILPVSCAAENAWHLRRWDHFMIPKPFSRIVLGVGEPYMIPPGTRLDDIEPHRLNVQQAVMSLMQECEDRLKAE